MREWTLEERYRVLEGAEDVRDLYDKIKGSVYRQAYHVQPVTGLSSDPNGFVYYEGQWHLFYQWCPWGAVHGLKYWYHSSSPDLVHWSNRGVGIRPDTFYDNKGCHSGSAIAEGQDLYFFYTGNHRDENWVRTPYTCAARMTEDGKLEKLAEPLFGPRPDYAEHQRDPKIVYVPERGRYYIFIGAQTADGKGTVLVYESPELLKGWKFSGQLRVPGYEDFGGMWECPCIVNISGRDVLIFSPQYTTLPGRGSSTNHNVYFIGKMDYDSLTFVPDGEYQHLDFGFDFYAAQCAANAGDPDRAVLIGWMGLPDNHYPTAEEDWEGSMSLARELRIRGGKLIQTPAETVYSLLAEEEEKEEADSGESGEKTGILPDVCVAEMTFGPRGDESEERRGSGETAARNERTGLRDKAAELALFTKEDGSGGFVIRYLPAEDKLLIDRSGMDLRFNENVYGTLEVPLDGGLRNLTAFIDRSSVELFINDGERTFTSHVYPTAEEHRYRADAGFKVRIRKLNQAVTDEFVI